MQEIIPNASDVRALLTRDRETIAVAESSTGGLISAALVGIAGASSYFIGATVFYTRKAINELLGLPQESLSATRALTETTALMIARRIRERLGATWAISEIGAAGPTGSRYGDPAGTSCIAVTGPVERTMTVRTGLNDRKENMTLFASAALQLMKECLVSHDRK